MRFGTSFAAAALAVGLVAAQTANAGVIITATANGTPIPGLNGVTVLPGVDPLSQLLRQIVTNPVPGALAVGNSVLIFASFSARQSYDPTTGAPADIISAIGNSTSIGILNTGIVDRGTDITVVVSVTFDGFNYPLGSPMKWASTISSARLDGGATFTASEVLTDTDPNTANYSVNHSVLTGADIANNTASQNIVSLVEVGRPFSVTQTLTVFLPGGAQANIQKADTFTPVTPVPEPTTLALLGAGLLGLGVARRYRRLTH
jgi:hypothetical protein